MAEEKQMTNCDKLGDLKKNTTADSNFRPKIASHPSRRSLNHNCSWCLPAEYATRWLWQLWGYGVYPGEPLQREGKHGKTTWGYGRRRHSPT